MKSRFETIELESLVRRAVRECLSELGLLSAPARTFDLKKREDQHPLPKLLLSSSAAAKLLDVSERTLWELKRKGELAYVPIGTGSKKESIRYALDDLCTLIEKRRCSGSTMFDELSNGQYAGEHAEAQSNFHGRAPPADR